MDNHDCGQIVKKLSEILKDAECPMCHSKEFSPLDSFVINSLSDEANSGPMIIARTIDCVAIVCKKCGFVSLHSAKALQLSETRANENE